mgnify:CR=1 FL=1
MRYLLSGGGTGGHIYPAIAIADRIKEGDPAAEILFIGAVNGLELDLVPKHGYTIKAITVSYLKRSLSLHNLRSSLKLMKGLYESYRILRDYKPDWVIGTGGYVSGPILYMAAKQGYRTLIHEQNAYPGLTNRVLSRYVDIVAISFGEAINYLKNKDVVSVTGNPIRKEYYELTDEEARSDFPEYSGKHMVLISGGSGGSSEINQAVEDMLRQYTNLPFSLYWATGKKYYKTVEKRVVSDEFIKAGHHIVPYINNMPYALKACDIIVCSAGAITIAEVQVSNKYAVLVPKSYTAENHQEKNAVMMEKDGYGTVIKEQDLTAELLFRKIVQGLDVHNQAIGHIKIRPAVDKIWDLLKKS